MEKDISQIIKTIIEPLLSVKEALFIKRLDKEVEIEKESHDNETMNYLVCLDNEDLAKVLTNHGQCANAIREVVNSITRKMHKRVIIKFESLHDDDDTDSVL